MHSPNWQTLKHMVAFGQLQSRVVLCKISPWSCPVVSLARIHRFHQSISTHFIIKDDWGSLILKCWLNGPASHSESSGNQRQRRRLRQLLQSQKISRCFQPRRKNHRSQIRWCGLTRDAPRIFESWIIMAHDSSLIKKSTALYTCLYQELWTYSKRL